MDRDQRSRSQKSSRMPPRRSLGSRLGLEKKNTQNKTQPRPARAPVKPTSTGAGRPPRDVQPPKRPPAGRRPPVQNNPQKPGYRPRPPHPQRRVTQAELVRRRNRHRLMGALAVFAVLVLGILLSINLLFKVADFRIENLDGTIPADIGPYREEQLLDILAVQEGDNLFGFSAADKAKSLAAALPYLDEVKVEISLPGTVVIKVRPAVERFTLEYGSGWLAVSESGKILRTAAERPEGLIWLEVNLPVGMDAAPGRFLQLLSENSQEQATDETAENEAGMVLGELLDGLRTEGLLDGVSIVSLTDLSELNFLYEGRISVKLGTANNLAYKLRLAAAAILDTDGKGLTATDRGTLDVSYQRTDGEIWAYFQAAEPEPETPPAAQGEPDEPETGGE